MQYVLEGVVTRAADEGPGPDVRGAVLFPLNRGPVEVRDVYFAYPSAPDTLVCNGYRLQVAAGQLVALCGPLGSGKSTLLQMISGLVPPSSGQLLIDGKEATHTAPGKRGIGLVFQSYALFPHMSVRDNVAYGLRMRKYEKRKLEEAVDDALTMVRMHEFAHRYPNELSGGQQQGVAVARARASRGRRCAAAPCPPEPAACSLFNMPLRLCPGLRGRCVLASQAHSACTFQCLFGRCPPSPVI